MGTYGVITCIYKWLCGFLWSFQAFLDWFFTLVLSLSYNIINFSHFFLLTFDHDNVLPSDTVYILTRPSIALPFLLLLFCLLFCYKILIASLFPFSNLTCLLSSYSPFLPDWRWFTLASSHPSHCHWFVFFYLLFILWPLKR